MRTDFSLDDATAVVATVGTTGTTSVDPVAELARRCEEAGVWLHVDAAYAGSAAICPELRWCLDGCDRADSIVVNPHKWLFTPMDCSTMWTRRPEAFYEAFAAHPDYLASTDAAVDLKDYGPALGRRFRALKLWLVLRMYGADGLRALIREHVRLAQLFASWVDAEPGWEVVAPHPFSTVCFRHLEADNDGIARRATATGKVFVATTRVRGDAVIRLCDREPADDRGRHQARVGGPVRIRAVIFDLWETLIDWDPEAAAEMVGRVSELAGDRFRRALEPVAEPVRRADSHGARRRGCSADAAGGGVLAAARVRSPVARAPGGRGRDPA